MLQYTHTFERWLLLYSKNLMTSIFSKRISEAVYSFLITNKLVTKSFSGVQFDSIFGHAQLNLEVKKIHRILLVNIRKRLPIIKLGDIAYESPFVELHNRSATLFINFEDSTGNLAKIERYIRFLKIQEYLTNNKIPLRLEIEHSYIVSNGIRKRIISLTLKSSILNRSIDSPRMYPVIFLIPTILKIITTLHRKALFRNDIITPDTTTATAIGEDGRGFSI